MKLYKKLIEDLPKQFEPEYGKHLFGDFRKLNEPDTEKEKKYFEIIKKWLKGNYESGKLNLSTIELQAFKDLMKLKKYEPEILKPETNILYRGVKKYSRYFDDFKLKKEDFELIQINGRGFYKCKKQINYKPNSEIQSWTTNFNMAWGFAIKNVFDYGKIAVIYKCKFPENSILFNSEFLNKVFKYELQGREENEVIHIGNKPLKCELMIWENTFYKLLDWLESEQIRKEFEIDNEDMSEFLNNDNNKNGE